MLVSAYRWWCHWLEMPVLPVLRAPADIPPFGANGMAGLALVGFIMIIRHTSSTIIRELWKNKVCYSQVLEGTLLVRGHTVRLWVERNSMDLGLCLYWGWGWGSWGLSFTLWGNGNTGGKSRATQMVSYPRQPGPSKRGTSWVGQFVFLSSCGLGNMFIGNGKGLMAGTYIQLKKKGDG